MILKARLAGLFIAACLQASPTLAAEEAQALAAPARTLAGGAPSNVDQDAREATAQVARMWFKAEWQIYASTFLTPDGRIVDNANGGVSHSEGQGYGLLLAAYADDSERFDRIWRWTQAHMMARPDHLLSWRWDPQKGAITDPNNATDGDILVAWALAQGAQKFNRPDYRASAALIAAAIGAALIQSGDHGLILLPAASGFARDEQPDGPVVNLSYWVFPAFPTLKELAPAYDWDGLRANGLKLLSASRFGPLRLPPDWLALGGQSPAPAKNFPAQFGYNAIRIPLYLAWDSSASARRALAAYVNLWRGPHSAGPYVIDVNSGSAEQILDGAGYRLALALARCAALGLPIDEEVIKTRDPLYYPDTLRLLSIAAIQERFPQCF